MPKCRYCGEPAGLFHFSHLACRERHKTGVTEIVALSHTFESPLIGTTNSDEWTSQIRRVAAENFVSENELHRLGLREWTSAAERALKDDLLSDNEEEHLFALAKGFSLSQSELNGSPAFMRVVKASVIRSVLSGKLPERFNFDGPTSINLRSDEKIVWGFERTDYFEDRTHRTYVGASHGLSIRIAKGIYYRTSAFRGQPVDRMQRVKVDTGLLLVTTKNLYFSGQSKSFRVPYGKIVSFHPFKDGIGIVRDASNAKPQIFVLDDGWFAFNIITNVAHLHEPNSSH